MPARGDLKGGGEKRIEGANEGREEPVIVARRDLVVLLEAAGAARWEAERVRVISGYLENRDPGIRRAALNAIGGIKDKSEATRVILARMLNEDALPELRMEAASALSTLGYDVEEVVPALIRGLEDKDADVRAWVAMQITRFGRGAKEAVPHLLAHLNDRDLFTKQVSIDFHIQEPVRFEILRAIGEIGDTSSRVVERVTAVMKEDKGADTRAVAAATLYRLTRDSRLVIGTIRSGLRAESGSAVDESLELLREIGDAAKEAELELILLLKSKEAGRRVDAIEALTRIGVRSDEVRGIVRKLAEADPEEDVRMKAGEWLKREEK